MEEKLKIKISIANRVYPLSIKQTEEEKIRKAAQRIESILKSFESRYAVQDKQDLIAMCALQLASECEVYRNNPVVEESPIAQQLEALNALIDKAMQG
jgi:cell division protein ZapA